MEAAKDSRVEGIRVALYLRVSTSKQTTENQLSDLRRVAESRQWVITKVYEDQGISGSKGRDGRPALNELLKDATRGRFDLIAVWSIDRIGRSLQHLIEIVNELHALSIDIHIHQQAIDTSTPAGKLAFSVFGSLAEYERSLIRERVKAGLDRARRDGVRLGRPSNLNDSARAAILDLRSQNVPIRRIASRLRVGTGSVYKVLGAALAGVATLP